MKILSPKKMERNSPPGSIWNETTAYTIRSNTFVDNQTGIYLAKDTFHLALKCNTFTHSVDTIDPVYRKGLVIGEGATMVAQDAQSFYPNQIGGAEGFLSGLHYPNANVWPTAQGNRGLRTIINGVEQNLHDLQQGVGWPNSPYWVAIDNQSPIEVSYYRYNNEFVGKGQAIEGSMSFPYPNPTSLKVATAGDSVAIGTPGYDFACTNFNDPQIVLFPARVAVISSASPIAKETKLNEVILGLAVPNPAKDETKIKINLPLGVEQASLQVIEFSTGKVLQNINLKDRGEMEVFLNTCFAPSGIYGFRLICDGKAMGSGKFVVVK